MSVGYVPVQWNRHKRAYDAVLAGGVVAMLAAFFTAGKLLFTGEHAISDEILAIRALGFCAFVLLHAALSIGPLARLEPRFLPLLYNRRHLGVTTFLVALAHGALTIGYYHGFGVIGPLRSLLTSNTQWDTIRGFPFQLLGAGALLVLFLLAATSHDFWNRNLGPRLWKSIHMLLYPAYALVILHVTLGALQTPRGAWLAIAVGAGAAWVCGLHLVCGWRERARDRARRAAPQRADAQTAEGWIDVADAGELMDGRGKAVSIPGGERVALFRTGDDVFALSNVCAHQGGPLGEGRIRDGCVTCPWHGWQYRPQDGCAPPPFTERVPVYPVRVVDGRVRVLLRTAGPTRRRGEPETKRE